MLTTYPRSFIPVPSVRLNRLFGLMSLLMCLLLSLVQPVAVRLNLPFPTTAEPALPYARADQNFFIENRGQFASELAAVMLAREAQLGVGHDGRLHLKVNDFPPLTLQFVSEGYTPTPQVVLTGPLATHVSFLTGNDPSRWQTKVPVWTEVQLKGVVPQLTLALTVAEGRLRIRALPTGQPDLTRIRLVIEGATVVGVGSAGVEVQVGERYLSLPLLEFASGNEKLHQVRPTMIGAHSVGAPIALTEMIRVHWPTLSSSSAAHLLAASTFLGGPGGRSGEDRATALKVDGQGTVVVAGETGSTDFPTTAGAYDATLDGFRDAFVAKLSSDLGTLQAATFLGGSSGYDSASALAIDGQGTVVVAGGTTSSDFPTTVGAYDDTHNGPSDAFVARLSFTFDKTAPADGATNQPATVTLQWQAVGGGVDHYRYCYATTSGCTPTTSVGTNTSVTLCGLTPGATYSWQVRACADSGCTVYIDANNGQHHTFTVRFPSRCALASISR